MKTLLYPQLLLPQEFGIVSLAFLITAVGATITAGGVLDGLVREVPILRGRQEDTTRLRSAGISAALCAASFATSGLAIAIGYTIWARDVDSALLWTAPYLGCTVLVNALVCDLQIREKSLEYAIVLFLKSALAVPIAIATAPTFGASGVLAAETAALLACVALTRLVWSRDLQLITHFVQDARRLVRSGFSFTLSSFVQNVGSTIDRWMVQATQGSQGLGTYAFAMNFTSVGLVLVNMLNLYNTPRILRAYGEDNSPQNAVRQATRVTAVTLTLFAIAAMPILVALPTFVRRWYPSYVDALSLLPWVVVGTLAMTASSYDVLFRASGRGTALLLLQALTAGGTLAAAAMAAWFGAPLTTYAVIFACGRLALMASGWIVGSQSLLRAR